MHCKFAIPILFLIVRALPASIQADSRGDVESRIDVLLSRMSASRLPRDGRLEVRVDIENIGDRSGDEVALWSGDTA